MGLGFWVWGVELRVYGLGFRVWGLGLYSIYEIIQTKAMLPLGVQHVSVCPKLLILRTISNCTHV